MKRITVYIFLWTLILCAPMIIAAQNTFPRLDSDYDSNLPVYQYMVNYVYMHKSLPTEIPLISSGISVWGDPLNSFFNPVLSLPLLLFGINIGIRLSIVLSCFLSGIFMYVLLKKFVASKWISLWGSFLYMSGGAFFARVAAGHIEKFLIYPFVPLLLYFSFNKNLSLKSIVLLGFVFSATIYSGDMYAAWFFFLIFTTIRTYYFFSGSRIRQIFYFILPLTAFLFLSLPKLLPFYLTVLPHMQRYNIIDPFLGSLHFFLFPLPFIMPFGVWFWDRPFFQRNLGFYFNWTEYFAFLSPVPFIFLVTIKKTFFQETVKILLLVLLMGILYFSLAYPYSPFFWLFHATFLSDFIRVPQRIVLPMTAAVVILLTVCVESWFKTTKKRKLSIALLLISLIWTLGVDWNIQLQTFTNQNYQQKQLIQEFAKTYKTGIAVVDFVPETQYFLIQNNIKIENYYYGWIPTGTITYNDGGSWAYGQLTVEKPVYVISKPEIPLTFYGYKNILKNSTIAVWERI